MGERRSGRKPVSRQSSSALGRQRWKIAAALFHTAPVGYLAVGSHETPACQRGGGSPRSLGLTEARDNRFSVSGIPDASGHRRRVEKKMEALGVARS